MTAVWDSSFTVKKNQRNTFSLCTRDVLSCFIFLSDHCGSISGIVKQISLGGEELISCSRNKPPTKFSARRIHGTPYRPEKVRAIQESNPENEPWVNVHGEQEQENTSSRDVRFQKKKKNQNAVYVPRSRKNLLETGKSDAAPVFGADFRSDWHPSLVISV